MVPSNFVRGVRARYFSHKRRISTVVRWYWRYFSAQEDAPWLVCEFALELLDPPEHACRELSPREFEILRLLVGGKSVDDIGTVLHISPKTVQNCHYQIKSKLGVKSDIELMRLAMRLRLVE